MEHVRHRRETVGPEGIDCSPRGNRPGFVRIANERTLMLPDLLRSLAVEAAYVQ